MPLKLRPTGLGSGIDKDPPDYTVYCGEWEVGRIYEARGGPDTLRWFWLMTVNGPMTRSDRVATLEEASSVCSQPSWCLWVAPLSRGALYLRSRRSSNPSSFAFWRTSSSSLHRKLAVSASVPVIE